MIYIYKNDDGLEVAFPYNEELLEIIRSFSDRYFRKKDKMWLLPLHNLPTLEERLSKALFKYRVIDNTTQIINTDYKFKLKPFPFQLEGFEFGKHHLNWILADDMGLGKTCQFITIADYKKDVYDYKHCLVLTCVKELRENWKREVEKFSDEDACIIGKGINGRYENEKGKLATSEVKDRIVHLEQIPKEYFWIMNIHSLREEKIVKILERYIKKGIISIIAIDEIHLMKKPTTVQGKGLLKLDDAKEKVCITGTPIENSPLDGFISLKFLGAIKQTWTAFQDYYCVRGKDLPFGHQLYGKIPPYAVVGYRNVDEYAQLYKPIMLRRKKEDVFDLPEKIIGTEFLEMNSKQRKVYDEVLEETRKDVKSYIKQLRLYRERKIDKVEIIPNPLALYTRLRQAAAHTSILSTKISESVKFERLYSKIEDSNEKFIVFSTWEVIIKMLQEEFIKFRPAMVTGKVNPKHRQDEIDRFQNDDKCRVILGTYPTLGVGFNLTSASRVEHFDNPWAMSTKNQANDRAHRIGTTGTVNVNTMICTNTIDEKIDLLVERKGAMADYIIDGVIQKNSEELLRWLMD
ncbi:MAG: DEAD/DEAH box helicase [bacterium]